MGENKMVFNWWVADSWEKKAKNKDDHFIIMVKMAEWILSTAKCL